MSNDHVHATHADVIKRLRRAEGHLRTVIKMIEQGRDCLELAQQLQAVEKSIMNAKKTLIHDHIDHCLEHIMDKSTRASRDSIDGFKQITKYL